MEVIVKNVIGGVLMIAALISPCRPLAEEAGDTAEVYFGRGNAAYKGGRFDAAVREYDRAIRLAPEFSHALFARGAANFSAGRYDLSLDPGGIAGRQSPPGSPPG